MNDKDIVSLFKSRDEMAVRLASEKYGSYCKVIAKNITGSEQSAEECFNDTLLKLWESIPPDEPEHLSAYMGRITRNISLNLARSENAKKRGGGEIAVILDEIEDFVSDNSSIEEAAEQHELLSAINDFLGGLPKKKRVILVLRYWHCRSVSDIAEAVGVTENAVSNTLKRERQRMKVYLKKRGLIDEKR